MAQTQVIRVSEGGCESPQLLVWCLFLRVPGQGYKREDRKKEVGVGEFLKRKIGVLHICKIYMLISVGSRSRQRASRACEVCSVAFLGWTRPGRFTSVYLPLAYLPAYIHFFGLSINPRNTAP